MQVEPIDGTKCPECQVDISILIAMACQDSAVAVREAAVLSRLSAAVPDVWVTCPNNHTNKYHCRAADGRRR